MNSSPTSQREGAEARRLGRRRRAALAVLALGLALAGLWFWYAFFGSRPRPVVSIALPADEAEVFCAFTGPAQIVFRSGTQLKGYDLKAPRETWSAVLLDETQIARAAAQRQAALAKAQANRSARDEADEEEELGPETTPTFKPRGVSQPSWVPAESPVAGLLRRLHCHVQGRQVWAVLPGRVVCFDGRTGRVTTEVPLPGAVVSFQPSETALLLLVQKPPGGLVLVRLELPGGETQTAEVPAGIVPPPRPPQPAQPKPAVAPHQPTTTLGKALASARRVQALSDERNQVMANVADGTSGRAEAAWVDASRTEFFNTGPNVARLTVRLVEKRLVTEGQRIVDESRYQVSLQRLLGEVGPEWTGEVTGPPQLFLATTVDVLMAGQAMQVFDKSNQPRWSAKLAFPVAPRFAWPAPAERAPCLEHGDSLYVFDQGTLTAFDAANGNVRWQWPTAGIDRVRCDRAGMLYVVTRAAGALHKVDARTGRILWRTDGLGDDCRLSGKFVYAVETGLATGAPLRVWRLNPRNGRVIWEYEAVQGARALAFQENTFVVGFPEGLQVLRFPTF